MMSGRQQVDWLQLPSNLWAAVFSRRKGAVYSCPLPHRQSRFFQLRLVCRTFSRVFEQFGHLNSHVHVSKHIQSCHLPSLVEWLQHHHAHVKHLEVQHGSPWLECALVALRLPHTCLEEVYLGASVPSTAMFLLSTFQSITTCTLQSSQTPMDLRPLSALPQLANLSLQHGKFSNLEAAAHLTRLSLYDAWVVCAQDCCCVSSLVELNLYGTKLFRFHRENVGACQILQSLSLRESYIHTDFVGVGEDFDLPGDDEDTVPSGLSALTALTSLQLEFTSSHVLDWVTTLSALQSFVVAANKLTFPLSWNNMTSLRNLVVDIRADDEGWDPSQPNAFFDFDWCKLCSLEMLQLNYVVLREQSMSGIASLQHLRVIEFLQVRPMDIGTANEIAKLAFNLGQQKRNVKFLLS